MAKFSLGIDIGGTFTDIVAYDHSAGRQFNRKILTSYDDPSRAVMEGIDALVKSSHLNPKETARVVHATTLFCNALIERRGAKTGLITTEGFGDSLEIARERKYSLYDVKIRKPEPLIPRILRHEATERIAANGAVKTELDIVSVETAAKALVNDGATSIAVVFLHAYSNPIHEKRAIELLADLYPQLSLTASSDVAPEIREYERASTTAANAYIKPLAASYLDSLANKINEKEIDPALHLMISSGGLTNVTEAKRTPVQMLESGPAAGALAGAFFGRDDADGNLLAFDMGGTTAKLSLVDDGEPLTAYSFEAGRQERFVEGSGLPISISTIELIEIGAGGGSIADIDHLGFLKVGPRSSGSEPGPAAYNRGGTEATVTDADFVLGYLNPDYFAGGMLTADKKLAEKALDVIAKKTGMERTEIAWGIHNVVNENMAGAARVHISERGRDPRDFTLLCTGGAGPVHAYYVARKLGLKKIICPSAAGVASALGLLVAPGRVDKVTTVGMQLNNCDLDELEEAFRQMEEEAALVITETGLDPKAIKFQRLADGRFSGQGFDLVVSLPEGPYGGKKGETKRKELLAAFEAEYHKKFSAMPPIVPVDFLNIRISAKALVPDSAVLLKGRQNSSSSAVKGARPAYFPESGEYVTTKVYDRSYLTVGERIKGPAIIEEEGSTFIAGPDATVNVSVTGNLIVTIMD
ncbi:MAG: hydantoinase [Magnetovibrio sp.]|nr:hydantoinase [Magnetovibrio sp.]